MPVYAIFLSMDSKRSFSETMFVFMVCMLALQVTFSVLKVSLSSARVLAFADFASSTCASRWGRLYNKRRGKVIIDEENGVIREDERRGYKREEVVGD